MFLVDTNIFLEVMLGQEKAAEVKDFFNRADFSSLFVSDFSLFSIGIIYFREKKPGPVHQAGQRRYWNERAASGFTGSSGLSKDCQMSE
jgi:predicted nucleic acid-binding protein